MAVKLKETVLALEIVNRLNCFSTNWKNKLQLRKDFNLFTDLKKKSRVYKKLSK